MRAVVISEREARLSPICIGCGRPTNCPGGLVCWDCFKRREDVTPLKYSGQTFEEWQRGLPPFPGEIKRTGGWCFLLPGGAS